MSVERGDRKSGFEGPSDQELIAAFQALPDSDPARVAAADQLVRRYESLVRANAQRYRDSPESSEDLMQVGYMGLMKAINNFDPQFGDSLAAYAQPCISGELKRHFRDKRWHIRVSRMAQELRLSLRKATAELTQQLGREPKRSELAEYLGVTEAAIEETELASQAFQADYLDAPLTQGEEFGSLADLVGGEDSRFDVVLDMDSVWAHLNDLPEREQQLLLLRFYGNMTQREIGIELGISQMHVSRLLNHALTFLREHLAAGEAQPLAS
ncbi:MAG TPA: SigB/SigF/SigG family RNA polymerase sigma factor [Streptosporangiaceae bacterium]